MLERTRAWLLAQRDGNGGYARKTHTLHTWLADADCASAYDTWALLAAGVKKGLEKEIAFAIDGGEKSKNTYAAALAANVTVLADEKAAARRLLDRLAGVQQNDGSLSGATTSIVGSGGEALSIETTALAVLAVKAIVAYDESRARPKAPGTLELVVDGHRIGDPVAFGVDMQGAIDLPVIDELLFPGEHTICLGSA